MKALFSIFILFPPLLAGCILPSSYEEQCLTRVCSVDPENTDAKYALDEYGLHQLTNDPPETVRTDGNWMIWLFSEGGFATYFHANMIGYNFQTDQFVNISASLDYHSTLPHVNDGRFLFAQEPKTQDAEEQGLTFLALWTQETGTWSRVDTGLDGEQLPYAFEWPWVMFRTRMNEERADDGVWIMNLETKEKVQIFVAPETYDADIHFWGMTVTEDTAYYALHRRSEDTSYVYEKLLPGGEPRLVWNGSELPADMDADGNYVAWYGVVDGRWGEAWVYDRETRSATRITEKGKDSASQVRVGGEWVTYTVSREPKLNTFHIEGYHIPTKTTHVLVEGNDDGMALESDTDGERLLVRYHRVSNFNYKTTGGAAYWMNLPDME